MTDYFIRDNGNDLNDGLSDANAVHSPNNLESKLSVAGDRGRFNRADIWTYGVFALSLYVVMSTAGSGSAEANRTRLDAYGSGAKPILDWDWNFRSDFGFVLQIGNDYQRITDIKVTQVGPQDSGTDVGDHAVGNSDNVLSPEYYNVDVDGAWRAGIQMGNYLGSGVIDGCTATDTNRSRLSGFNWGGGMVNYRTMNTAVVSGITRNCTVFNQSGEAVTCSLSEDFTATNNWCWGNWALQFFLQASRDVACYLNRAEGTTNSAYWRSSLSAGNCYGYDIEFWESTARAQQADDGNAAFYLNLGSGCYAGIYWPWAHPDAGPPQNIDWDHMTIVDCEHSFEIYNTQASTSNCSVRCNIFMQRHAVSSQLDPNGNDLHDVSPNYNYWDTTNNAPDSSFIGPNDVFGTTHLLARTSGWRTADGSLAATDYIPQASLTAINLGYGRDYDTASATMNEFGAYLFAGGGGGGGGGGSGDIRVERHVVDFGASADTYTLTFNTAGSNTNRIYPHLTNVRKASGGQAAGITSQQTLATTGVYIDNITTTTLRLNRHASGSNVDVRCYVEIWFYEGAGSGANEFIVRGSGVELLADSALTATESISSVSNSADLLVESLGVASDAAGGYAHFCRLSLSGTTMTTTRENSTGALSAAWIAVEFTGSNWLVQQVTHDFTAVGTWNTNDTETISSITAWTQAFIISSFEAFDDENQELSCLVWPGSSVTTVRFRMQSASGTGSLGIVTAFVVRNASLAVQHFDTVTGGSSEFGSTTSPGAQTFSFTALDDLNRAGIIMHGVYDDNAFNGTPDGFFNYRIYTNTQLEIWRSWGGGTMEWAAQIVDFSDMGTSTFQISGTSTLTFTTSGALTIGGQISASIAFTFNVYGGAASVTPAVLTAYAGTRDFNYGALELDDDAVDLVVLAYLDFEGEPTFLHSGIGILTWNNEDWLGVGNFGSIEPVSETIGVQPSRFRMSLLPVAAEFLNSAVNEPTWGRVCELYLAGINPDGQLVGTPELIIRGLMGAPEAVIGENGSITIPVEDVRSLVNRSNGMRASVHDHQAQAPNDMFYEFLPKMLDHKFIFNGVVQGSTRVRGGSGTWTYDNWTPPP